ncbi:hypothetical protein [Chryseobacterium taichungense]|uniref:hypothetical protein n=1 Tax=Chryseobacterium taichungense TaxID=295069 RepID=UPI0028A95C3B|nr:hypothetical protein [Chryseobacterium taichungense]
MKTIKVKKIVLLSLLNFCAIILNAQSNTIYFFKNRYNAEVQNFLESRQYKSVELITNSSIVDNKGKVNEAVVKNNLAKILKSKPDLLIIDWEKEDFWNLKKKVETNEFINAEAEFIKLIDFIKRLYPSQKLGIYGLPFKVFININAAYNEKNKFDRILSKVDVICPSMYFDFLDIEKGRSNNYQYLKNQLNVSLDYGLRLNKPVIPFIWEVVHPNNKKYGGGLIPKQEFEEKINYIKKFQYKDRRISGLIWWAPGNVPKAYNIESKSEKNNRNNANSNRNIITKEYVELLD